MDCLPVIAAVPTASRTFSSAIAALETAARRNTELHAAAASVGHRMELAAATAAHVGRYGPDDAEPLTHFHTTEVPAAGIADMYRHLTARCPAVFDDDTGLIAVTLMLRYQRMTGLPITTAMLHRLFITAVLVASKSHHERGLRNTSMARRFGIRAQEMNLLERCLVVAIDYRCMVVEADVEGALADLVLLQHGRPSLRRPLNNRSRSSYGRTPLSRGDSFAVASPEAPSATHTPAPPPPRTTGRLAVADTPYYNRQASFVSTSGASTFSATAAHPPAAASPLPVHAADDDGCEDPWCYA